MSIPNCSIAIDDVRIVSQPCADYNKLYFDKIFAFALEIGNDWL